MNLIITNDIAPAAPTSNFVKMCEALCEMGLPEGEPV